MMELSWMCLSFALILSFFSYHPLILCLALIFLTLSLSPLITLMLSKWLAYAIILIFLGGMMVLFIYVSTLAGNEKLVFMSKTGLYLLPAVGSLAAIPVFESSLLLISHLYSSLSISLLLFLTLYLLATLVIVVYLAQGFKGALMTYI